MKPSPPIWGNKRLNFVRFSALSPSINHLAREFSAKSSLSVHVRYYAHKSPQSSLGERLASNPGEDLLEGWRGRTSRKHHRTSAEVGRRAEGHVAAGEDLEVSGMGMLLFMRLAIGEFWKQEPQKRLDLALQVIVRCRFSLKATAVSIASLWSSPWVLPTAALEVVMRVMSPQFFPQCTFTYW